MLPNGHSFATRKQQWQHSGSCPRTDSTSGKSSMMGSRPNLSPSVQKTGFRSTDISKPEKIQPSKPPNQSPKHNKGISSAGGRSDNTNASDFMVRYPVGSNEKEFMEYLQAQAIQHERADDAEYEVVRCREVCVLNSLHLCNVFLATQFFWHPRFENHAKGNLCHLFKARL